MKRNHAIISCLAAIVVILDQWSKQVAVEHLKTVHQSIDFLGWWKWTLVHNYGIVFGILNPPPPWLPETLSRVILFVLPFLVLGFVWWTYVRHFKANEIFRPITVGLILGGAVGNIIDRLRYGFVIDFVDWFYPAPGGNCFRPFYEIGDGNCHWPVFNVADSAVSCALVMLVIEMVFLHKKYNS